LSTTIFGIEANNNHNLLLVATENEMGMSSVE